MCKDDLSCCTARVTPYYVNWTKLFLMDAEANVVKKGWIVFFLSMPCWLSELRKCKSFF